MTKTIPTVCSLCSAFEILFFTLDEVLLNLAQ